MFRAIAASAVILCAVPTLAQDRGAWFKSLKQNGTGQSCCDISDCKRTDADWRDGQWWAVVPRYDGAEWEPIPPEVVLDKQSIDGDAYVCNQAGGESYYSPGTGVFSSSGWTGIIYCFVPPHMGY